jgi:hypothetical protein
MGERVGMRLMSDRAVLAAGPYHDTSEEGKYYAVLLEQIHTQAHAREEGVS